MKEPYELKLKDGTTYQLRYSFKAIRYFEKLSGQFFFGDSGAGRIGAEYVCSAIAAGLLWRGGQPKADDVAEALDRHMEAGGDMPTVITALMEGLQKFGVLKVVEGETPPEPRPTTPAAAPAQ
jgi:hypothetical protein